MVLPTETEQQPPDSDTRLRRRLLHLIEGYELEIGTVLSPPSYATSDHETFTTGTRSALTRAVNDLKALL